MKRFNLLILSLIFTILTVGCSDNNTIDTNSNANSASVANQNSGVNLNTANYSPNAGTVPPVVNVGGATTSNLPANVTVVKGVPSREPNAKPPTQSAPDNSEVTTALGQNLVQTRVFKNHPKINKIESVSTFVDGKERKTVKIYLKNGQVRELPDGQIKDAMTEAASNILKAIN